MPSAYLLVSHGSRDSRPRFAMEQLARLLRKKLQHSVNVVHAEDQSYSFPVARSQLVAPPWEPLVGTACLELSPEPLHEQIRRFGDRALAAGYNQIQVLPLFLLPGVHVMEDIPGEVAIAQSAIGQGVNIDLRPHLGTHPGLSHLFNQQQNGTAAWILLAHGSSRVGSEQSVETVAGTLGAIAAYWAVAPKLELRVKELVSAGHQRIRIVPYFLFPGGITDAIAQLVEQIKVQFPTVSIHLAEPLGASAELADLIWDLTSA